jgi:glucose-6-phosphate 1-epimerase
MTIISLRHPSGATAQIQEYGAHVTSWRTADDVERLFLSERAEFKPGVAIRGGVPIIFPQFAALGPLPKHGFARTLSWHAESNSQDAAAFSLVASDATMNIWPYRFAARYQVALQENALQLQLSIHNTDKSLFAFTAALHTYLRVQDIAQVSLQGLQGCRYRDTAHGGIENVETNPDVRFIGEVDRIYVSTSRPIQVRQSNRRPLQCDAQGFTDTVIWNPGAELSRKLADMQDEGYRNMVCVEAAAIATPVVLQPGEAWRGLQRLQLC